MLVASFVKDPAALLDYYIDWQDFLAADTITTSTWSTTSSVILSQEGIAGAFTVVWVAGGQVGEPVELVNHIVTAEGRHDERTLGLIIRNT